MITPPKGTYRKKYIVIDDGTNSYEVEVPWYCTQCGYDTRLDPVLEYFPATGKSYHTWGRTCFCSTAEYYYDVLEQARLYGQIITRDGKPTNTDPVFCVKCHIYCPYTFEREYTCWVCRNWPYYGGSCDDD